MTRTWCKVVAIVAAVLLVVVVALALALSPLEWHWQVGTVGDWVAGLATAAGVLVALWVALRAQRQAQLARAEALQAQLDAQEAAQRESRRRDLEETRRVAYMLRMKRSGEPPFDSSQLTMMGTLANALIHHSRMRDWAQADDLANAVIAANADEPLDALIAELTTRLVEMGAEEPAPTTPTSEPSAHA